MKTLIKKNLLLKQNSQELNISYFALVSIFSIVLFYLGILTRFTTDYNVHTNGIEKIHLFWLLNPLNWPSFFVSTGYPLWFICGKIIMRFFSCPPRYAAGICTGLFLIVSYIGVLDFFKYKLGNKTNKNLIALMAFILFIVGPVWLPWRFKHIILGLGGPNVWHNATNICGRAVGIYAFYYSMKCLDTIIDSDYKNNPTLKQWIVLMLLYYLSLLAKPSFAQSFVPAFGVVLFFYLIKSKGRFLKSFLYFLMVAIIPLTRFIWMYFFYFGNNGVQNEKTGEKLIFIIPSIKDVYYYAIKIQILIILFPLVIFSISFLLKRFTRYHCISIIMWLLSRLYVLTLRGSATGEMGWCYYLSVFFVFLISFHDYILHFFNEKKIFQYKIGIPAFILSTVILSEHFIVGLYYLFQLVVMGNPKF